VYYNFPFFKFPSIFYGRMQEKSALQKIMIPAFDISYGMFGHGPPGKIRYLKIISLLFRLYHANDFNFTKAVDKIE